MMRITVRSLVLATFVTLASTAFAQSEVTSSIDTAFEPAANVATRPILDPAVIVGELALRFSVSVDELTPLLSQGYNPGEIRFALEISAASGKTLPEVLALAGTETDRNWHDIATSLGLELKAGPMRGDGVRGQGGPADGMRPRPEMGSGSMNREQGERGAGSQRPEAGGAMGERGGGKGRR